MEDGFDGRFFRLGVNPGGQEGVIHLLVGQAFFFQQGQQGGETALDDVVFLESAEAGAAGFDEKGVVAKTRGGVAFAEHGQTAVFAAQFAGKGEEVLKDWILHLNQFISWPPVTLKAMPVM
jgi:hypothetical protein